MAFPDAQIGLLLAMAIGILDVSVEVLMNLDISNAWKLVASVEVLVLLLVFIWLLIQQRRFRAKTAWSPFHNLGHRKLFLCQGAAEDSEALLEDANQYQKDLPVALENATIIEAFWAMILTPRRMAGEYLLSNNADMGLSIEDLSYGRFFER